MQTVKTRPFVTLIAAAVLFQTSLAAAAVAFSSLGVGGTYQAAAYLIGGSNSPLGYFEVANKFIPTVSGTLSSIELGTGYYSVPDQLDVSLRPGGASFPPIPPTSYLFSDTITTTFPFSTNNTALLTLTPSTEVSLTAGESYWLVVRPHTPQSYDDWAFGFVGGTFAYSEDAGATWSYGTGSLNAFVINVVPEPATPVLAGLGAAALLLFRRQFRGPDYRA